MYKCSSIILKGNEKKNRWMEKKTTGYRGIGLLYLFLLFSFDKAVIVKIDHTLPIEFEICMDELSLFYLDIIL